MIYFIFLYDFITEFLTQAYERFLSMKKFQKKSDSKRDRVGEASGQMMAS